MLTTFDRRISTLLKTWLTAVGIPHEDADIGLVVTNKEGRKVPVFIASEGAEPPREAVVVNGPALTNRDLKKGLETFAGLQAALGYEPRLPVDRGEIPTRKAHYSDSFELVAMRHSEFRRAPNPDPVKLKAYGVAIDKAAWKFYRKNMQVCQDHILDVDDLRTYAQVWTVNFIAMYEVQDVPFPEKERFLSQYLGQRFYELRQHLDKKGRNTLPMLDDAFIAVHGRPYDYANKSDWYANSVEDEAEEFVGAVEEEEETPVQKKERTFADRERSRKESANYLDTHLAEMGHDDMVDILSAAIENDRIHEDARREASRRLRGHAISCPKCVGRELPRAHGDDPVPSNVAIKDEKGVVYANAREAAKALGVFPSNVRAVLSGRYRHTGGHTFTVCSPTAEEHEEAPGAGPIGAVEEA